MYTFVYACVLINNNNNNNILYVLEWGDFILCIVPLDSITKFAYK